MDDPAGEFAFELPQELIAQDPPQRREDSRLLLVHPGRGVAGQWSFGDLPGLLRAKDLLVLNDSRVLPARLDTRRLDTGGRVEILLVRPEGPARTWLAMARPARRLRPGTALQIAPAPGCPAAGGQDPPPRLTVAGVLSEGEVLVQADRDPGTLAEAWGSVPLPPYIRRPSAAPDAAVRAESDRRRYQTVYAARGAAAVGSVAAPTAGLHFSRAVLQGLQAAGVDTTTVRLHVGPGTFRPPGPGQIAHRRLHPEAFTMGADAHARIAAARAAGGRVIAVGTTALRVLETVARLDLAGRRQDRILWEDDPGQAGGPVFTGEAVRRGAAWEVAGRTRLFILPPQRVTAADGLLTNFHLPGSSLLMLVGAVLGGDLWREVYLHAVKARLRFFSYGDCMLILPDPKGCP